MSVVQQEVNRAASGELRRQPIAKRIRAELDGQIVVDTTEAVLVWEPRRLLCEYAVPEASITLDLIEADRPTGLPDAPEQGPIYPDIPFAVHTTDGVALDLRAGDTVMSAAGFRAADPDLAGYVVLDFHAFDSWYQEDEPNLGHPRDPFHRIDAFATSRRVQVTAGATVLADSRRAVALFEAGIPTRFYLPMDDVRVPLTPTETRSVCAYKGRASYWSADADGRELTDVAWGYLDPLPDSDRIRGMVCFDDSAVTVTVDPS